MSEHDADLHCKIEGMNATTEEGLAQYELFANTLRTMAVGGRDAGAEGVTIDIEGFCQITDQITQHVADCRRLYEERNAALSQATGLAAAEKLARVLSVVERCDGCPGYGGCERYVDEDACTRIILNAALSSAGEPASERTDAK